MEELYEKYQNKYALSKLAISSPRILDRLEEFNNNKDYHKQIKPSNFSILGFSNIEDEETSEPIKPIAPFTKPAKHAVYGKFVDYNTKKRRKLSGKQYWKTFWDTFREYLDHPESKFDGSIGILERKHVRVTKVMHIGKESNNLDESEFLGVDADSYETYHDDNIDAKFRKIANDILRSYPRDVKPFGISKQTLSNVKRRIKGHAFDKIALKTKIKILQYFMRFS